MIKLVQDICPENIPAKFQIDMKAISWIITQPS